MIKRIHISTFIDVKPGKETCNVLDEAFRELFVNVVDEALSPEAYALMANLQVNFAEEIEAV